jgi:hypothetical protein
VRNVLKLFRVQLMPVTVGKSVQTLQEVAVLSGALNGLPFLRRQSGVIARRGFAQIIRERLATRRLALRSRLYWCGSGHQQSNGKPGG